MEMELYLVKKEKDRLKTMESDYLLKLKDVERHREQLNKENLEKEAKFKSELQQDFKNSDFDIHRRKLQLIEDETRVKNDRDRYAMLEKQSIQNETLVKESQKENNDF
jgi:hypothetical protein